MQQRLYIYKSPPCSWELKHKIKFGAGPHLLMNHNTLLFLLCPYSYQIREDGNAKFVFRGMCSKKKLGVFCSHVVS